MAAAQSDRRRAFPLGRVLLAVGAIALVVRTIDVLLVVFLAVILAVYLEAVAEQLERRLEMPRPVGWPSRWWPPSARRWAWSCSSPPR